MKNVFDPGTTDIKMDDLVTIFEEELADDYVLPDEVKRLVIEKARALKVRRR